MKDEKFFPVLLATSSAHAKTSRKIFAELGLTEGQPKVLYILRKNDGIIQKELAKLCHVSQPTLTGILSKMITLDLIYKKAKISDDAKRAYTVHLTEKGKKKADILSIAMDDLEAVCLQDFSEADQEQLIALLRKVENNLMKGSAQLWGKYE